MRIDAFYNEVLLDHNRYPMHKRHMATCTCSREGINPSCGDDIVLSLDLKDGIINDAAFDGSGCAISQASCDIMLDLVIGKSKTEALELYDLFMKMIREGVNGREEEKLEEATALKDISHMPARVQCRVLGWNTLAELLNE